MTSRILLADDSITIQKVVNLTFADEGIEVVAVSNGELAERRLSEISPDLVLADIFMPGKNGYELCEFVKQNPQFRNVPVVLLVGAFEPFNEAEARRVRADAHLTKPFESRILVDTVRKLIGKGGRSNTGALPPRNAEPERSTIDEVVPLNPVAAPPAFHLDLSAMTADVGPAETQQQFSPGANGTDGGLVDVAPLELDYGSLAQSDSAPTGFQMDVDEQAPASGFSFAIAVRDTAELPPVEEVSTPSNESAAIDDAVPFQALSGFADNAATVQGIDDALGERSDVEGFSAQSTPGAPLGGAIVDFDKVDAPQSRPAEDAMSFEVDFSPLESASRPEFTVGPGVEASPETTWSFQNTAQAQFKEYKDYQVTSSDETPAQTLPVDDPLGDVLASEPIVAESGPVEASFEFAALEVGDVAPEPEPAAQPFSEDQFVPETTEAEGAVLGDLFSATDRPGVVHSGLSFEAFSPVLEESTYEEPAPYWKGPAPVVEALEVESAPELIEPASASTPTSEPEAAFTSSEMWAGEAAQFSAIDIEAVAVDEAQETAFAASDDETGFAFASVAEPVLEVPELPEPAPPAPPPAAVEAAVEPTPAPSSVSSSATQGDAVSISPAVIDEIVRRVVAELGESVVREIAWEVVPDCVERVVEKLTHEGIAKRM